MTPDRNPGTKKDQEQEKTPTYAKDSWAQSWLVGNVDWPQSAKIITARVAAAVILDQPSNWQDFASCVLSPKHIQDLATSMDSAHRISNVAHYSQHTDLGRPNQLSKERIVTDERLQKLWARGKLGAVKMLAGYFDSSIQPLPEAEALNDRTQEIELPNEEELRILQSRLEGQNHRSINQLTKAAKAILEYLDSREARMLSDLHRREQLREPVRENRRAVVDQPRFARERRLMRTADDKKKIERVVISRLEKVLAQKSLPRLNIAGKTSI